jgi:hypothetical protein
MFRGMLESVQPLKHRVYMLLNADQLTVCGVVTVWRSQEARLL